MTFIKICGVTNIEDAMLAAELGADAIGLNFVAASPRFIDKQAATEIVKRTNVKKIGVYVDESTEEILDMAPLLDAIQLHGDESPEFVRELKLRSGRPVIKAFQVSTNFDPRRIDAYSADAILLDAFSGTMRGGTGHRFDWEIAQEVRRSCETLYLAGGISPENARDAIRRVRPYALDICSGVESEKGKKDPEKMKQLFDAVNGMR
jgi:phosphoribosylanthranilate isomerase